jgi:hypothetical protein
MRTDNSPDSGLELFRRKFDFSIQILPGISSNITLETAKHIHPLLRLSDAQTFVLVLKAGGTWYSSPNPITDPLFEARKLAPQSIYYIPDREATGIGCGEQTQICIDFPSGLKCYPWTKGLRDYPRTLFRDLQQFNDIDTVREYMVVFWRNLESSSGEQSLQYFIRRRFILPNPLLVKPLVLDPFRISMIRNIDTERQWISELSALFNKARYWQKITTLAIVRNTLNRKNNTPFDLGKYSLCDKILFIDADFTNINWIGMWITVGVLLLLWIISYGVSLLEWASRNNISLMNREVWEQFRINTSKWLQKNLDRICKIRIDTSKWLQKKLDRIRKIRIDTSKWLQKKLDRIRRIRIDTSKWAEKILDRISGIPRQDVPVNLSTLPAQAPRPLDEEPDDPV